MGFIEQAGLTKLATAIIEWLGTCPCSCNGCTKLRATVREVWPKPTAKEMEEQRRSFAYGNVALHNPNVTRELVDQVADEMAENGKR